VKFPNYTYEAHQRFITNDPFDFAVGVINLRTGKSIGDFIYRGLPLQDLFLVIQAMNAGRIPTETFRYKGPAWFEKGPNGSLVFRFRSELFLDFSTFLWPLPDYNPVHGFRAGDNTRLNPFLKFQGILGGSKPTAVKNGQINTVSMIGDPVSINYSIPCDPSSNQNFFFQYTNRSDSDRGGTFTMDALASSTCFNPAGSAAAPGDGDVVTFSGFGSWSKDSDQHLATVSISAKPGENFYILQIDGFLSTAETQLDFETSE
jgi:hypothetical protein